MYISTEAPLNTTRLAQLLRMHPTLSQSPKKPSLDAILSISVPDLESQDHILRYQLPVSVRRHNVGLVVIDSVASNYRAELDARRGDAASMARRSAELVRLGALLREIARTENVAVVVANQVADRFMSEQVSRQSLPVPPPSSGSYATGDYQYPLDRLSLDHQQRWFTGWGDEEDDGYRSGMMNLKTPSLGHTWTLQISARIVLLKEAVYVAPNSGPELAGEDRKNATVTTSEKRVEEHHKDPTAMTGEKMKEVDLIQERDPLRWQRRMKVVFAPWTASTGGEGVEFAIAPQGITAV